MRRNPIAVLYLLLVILFLFSSYQYYQTTLKGTVSQEDQPVKSEDTLVVIASPRPGNLWPYSIRLVDDIFLINQIFQGMIRLNSQLVPVPDLARYWTLSADRLTYTFFLDSTRTFHNGQPVTAYDVLASFHYFFQHAQESYNLPYFKVIKGLEEFLAGKTDEIRGIQVLDSFRIKIHLKRPFAPFLTLFALPEVKILPATMLSHPIDPQHPPIIGSGAYRVKERSDTALVLEAAHWDPKSPDPPYIKTVFFPLGKNQSAYAESLFFDINTYYYFVGDWVPEVFQVVNQPTLGLYLLGFNCSKYPTSSRWFRKAIGFAIDRKRMVDSTYGMARLQKHFTPFYYPHEGSYAEIPEYNLDSARFYLRKFLQQADSIPTIVLTGDSIISDSTLFNLVTRFLNSLQIPVKVIKYNYTDSNREIKFIKQTPHIFLWGWSQDLPDPYFYFDVFLRSDQQMNLWQFRNPVIDSLLNQAANARDARERNRCYTQIENILARDLPFIPLYNLRDLIFLQKYIRGLALSPMGISHLNLSDIWKDPKIRRALHASNSQKN